MDHSIIPRHEAPRQRPTAHMQRGEADHDTPCYKCGATPTVHPTQQCAACLGVKPT